MKYQVQAEYPYSTVKVDTPEQVLERIDFEKNVHGVSCRVRRVSKWVDGEDLVIVDGELRKASKIS